MISPLVFLNPYSGADFTTFFWVLAQRLFDFSRGRLGWSEVASDELQAMVFGFTAISLALIGSQLLLRRLLMVANALSHTMLFGIVAVFCGAALFSHEVSDQHALFSTEIFLCGALLAALITTMTIQLLTDKMGLYQDASIALVFTGLFSIAIIAVTLFTRDAHIGTEVVLGNADLLSPSDGLAALVTALIVVTAVVLAAKELAITALDPFFARTVGVRASLINYLVMALTALGCVSAFRAVGVIVVLSFLTAPPMIARMVGTSLRQIYWLSAAVGTLAALFSVAVSRHCLTVYGISLSTSGLSAIILALLFLAAAIARRFVDQRIAAPVSRGR